MKADGDRCLMLEPLREDQCRLCLGMKQVATSDFRGPSKSEFAICDYTFYSPDTFGLEISLESVSSTSPRKQGKGGFKFIY